MRPLAATATARRLRLRRHTSGPLKRRDLFHQRDARLGPGRVLVSAPRVTNTARLDAERVEGLAKDRESVGTHLLALPSDDVSHERTDLGFVDDVDVFPPGTPDDHPAFAKAVHLDFKTLGLLTCDPKPARRVVQQDADVIGELLSARRLALGVEDLRETLNARVFVGRR